MLCTKRWFIQWSAPIVLAVQAGWKQFVAPTLLQLQAWLPAGRPSGISSPREDRPLASCWPESET
jgi:hypothetical protein